MHNQLAESTREVSTCHPSSRMLSPITSPAPEFGLDAGISRVFVTIRRIKYVFGPQYLHLGDADSLVVSTCYNQQALADRRDLYRRTENARLFGRTDTDT